MAQQLDTQAKALITKSKSAALSVLKGLHWGSSKQEDSVDDRNDESMGAPDVDDRRQEEGEGTGRGKCEENGDDVPTHDDWKARSHEWNSV